MLKKYSSESVSPGHPDKISDQIADAILDEVIKKDKFSRSAIEVTVSTGDVSIFGELSTNSYVNVRNIAMDVIENIGYTDAELGFTFDSVNVSNKIVDQSPDISEAVNISADDDEQIGAGDQGMVFGFATDETPSYMPLPFVLSNQLIKKTFSMQRNTDFLRPDSKAEVIMNYVDGKPTTIDTVLISIQHSKKISLVDLRKFVEDEVIYKSIDKKYFTPETKILVNPGGNFIVGGPQADSGLTGRKIIVDTYGGFAKHGGGSFSGKDATKVDRSAAYMARYVAKNLVAAGVANKLEIQVSYSIGLSKPISINVDTFGTNKIPEEKIYEIIDELFDFRPQEIISKLNLLRPIYRQLSYYGHFGRDDLNLTWEKLDNVEQIKSLM